MNNEYIYDVCMQYNILFYFKDYIRFWFGLINQKMFEMKILKWPT